MEAREKEMKIVEQPSEGALADALDIIESRNALFQRVMQVAISATSQGDWIDQEGKPYLQASGAEKVARRFGVRIYDVEIERENLSDDNGQYYLYTVTGKAAIGNGRESIESIGTCSSRDKFFGRAYGKNKPMQDVDIGNVKKKAYTNFMGNAITRLLGIRNLSWDDLSKYGINRSGKPGVTYQSKGAKAAETKASAKAAEGSKKPYWTSDWKGKVYLHARVGQHYDEDFLVNLGMKKSQKTEGLYSIEATPEIEQALEEEFVAADETLAVQQEGGAA